MKKMRNPRVKVGTYLDVDLVHYAKQEALNRSMKLNEYLEHIIRHDKEVTDGRRQQPQPLLPRRY